VSGKRAALRIAGLVGQPRVTAALEGAFASGRFHPSLIFHGPAGTGKLTAALALGRALLCTRPVEGGPCDTCASCHRIDARSLRHPDLRVVLPESKPEFDRGEPVVEGVSGIDVQERQAAAVRHSGWDILIDRIRGAIGFVQRRPSEGGWSVLVVDQAHRLGGPSGNALLKTVEEPPEHSVIVLLTHDLHALLPTLRSRCQSVPFQLLPADAVAAWLQSERGLAPDEARQRAALSGGRIGAALEVDLEATRARREENLKLLESFLRPPDPGQAVWRAEQIAKAGETASDDLEILAGLLRDRMILAAAGPGAPGLLLADVAARLQALPAGDDGGVAALQAIESAIEGIARRGNRQMLLENAFLELLPPAGAPRPAR
jgi:DNA polymerase-3 subunit delta'